MNTQRFILSFLVCLCITSMLKVKALAPLQVKDDSAKVNLLNRMAFSLRESDNEMALKYAQDALALAESLNYERGKATALGNIGWINYRKSDFAAALRYSLDAIKLSEKIGFVAELGRSQNNIASVYFEQKQFEKSLAEFKKALLIAYQIRDEKLEARTLNNLSYTYLMGLENTDSAEYYARKAIVVSEKIKDTYLTAFALRTLGDVLVYEDKIREAIQLYQRAIAMAVKNKNTSMSTATNHRLAKAYVKLNRLSAAKEILIENAVVAKEKEYPEELERTYKLLAEVYFKEGNSTQAYQYLHEYTTLHDSIFSDRNSKQIALQQGQYELEMKQAQIELLTKEAALRQEEISRQRMQLYITIITSSGAILLVLILLYVFQKSKRINHELQKQKEQLALKNAEVEQKSQELARLNATKDKLFSIIGHDFRSPLNSLKGLLNLIGNKNMSREEFELFSQDLRKRIDVIYDNLDNILNWSVTQLKGIQANPSVINPYRLTDEIFILYQEMARTKSVSLVNAISKEIYALADADQIRLVLRNLVSNSIKFTSPEGFVKASAELVDGYIQISIQDSGIGMSGEDLQKLFVKDSLWSLQGTQNEKGLGLGLLLCKEFIEKNQGKLTVTSQLGVGTIFKFTLPLSRRKNEKEGTQLPVKEIVLN